MIDAETVILLIALGLIFIWLVRKIRWEIKHRGMAKLDVEGKDDWTKVPTELFERLFSDVVNEADRRGLLTDEKLKAYTSKYRMCTDHELQEMMCDLAEELRRRNTNVDGKTEDKA